MSDVPSLLTLILVNPIVAAALIWIFGRQRHNLAAGISVLSAGIGMVAGLLILLQAWDGEALQGGSLQVEWLTLGSWTLNIGFYLNEISAAMLGIVTFVGFWIHLFSLGYMQGDAGKGRFFGGLSIFMFSMLGIVLADNLFMVFIFWELVGFSSYMLIGHYLTDVAAAASRKAFITNRVGDFGFLLGIVMIFWQFGTTDLVALGEQGVAVSTVVGLLFFCGVLGKSAQMPLHVWLPDAMAGPTPISALIHAATMVAAGVFLLARTYFLFDDSALQVIGWIGTITALSAAIWAFAQRDIKKILAYSTLSQLGYMVAAFGLGTLYGRHYNGEGHAEFAALWGVGASMFHLTTHAFFKALMFLGSGSVIHACHREQDIFKMGGLWKKMPITGTMFFIGLIAIAGVPFLGAGFFSKDLILVLAKGQSAPAFYILTFTAVLTAIYMGRLFVIAFLGKANSEHAKETSWTMWLPLVVLAIFSVGAIWGLELFPKGVKPLFHDYVHHAEGNEFVLMVIISSVASIVGLAVAYFFYGAGAATDRLESALKPLWSLSRSRFYFDEIYSWYVKNVQDRVAVFVDFFDALFIGGLGMRGSAGATGLAGMLVRSFHGGSVAIYVWSFFIGVVIVWVVATDAVTSLF
jgi:NADH-quinone oxidoreductase subunit L|tara:strand:- start:11143 stop:13044 length:1902 start_codon:yes stop_codon:yes gene_type:complete